MATRTKRNQLPSLWDYPQQPTGTNAHLAPANAATMHHQLRGLVGALNAASRTLRGAYLAQAQGGYGIDDARVAQYRQELVTVRDEYNAAVTAWHAAWAPWRAAERVRRNAVRQQLQAQRQAAQRAKLRAAACIDCGLIHAGEC